LGGQDGRIVPSSANDTAIVPKGKQLLANIQSINQQLTNINKQIQNKTKSGQPIYAEQSRVRNLKTSELISQFVSLTEERNKIGKMINDYQTLDEKQTQGNLTINQNYYSFILLLFLAIIVIFCLFYFGGSSSEAQGVSSIITTNFIVVISFLISLLIVCVVIVMNKTGIQVNRLPTNWFPTSLPELKLSKFGWT
jgi:type II secretory pathway component PulF